MASDRIEKELHMQLPHFPRNPDIVLSPVVCCSSSCPGCELGPTGAPRAGSMPTDTTGMSGIVKEVRVGSEKDGTRGNEDCGKVIDSGNHIPKLPAMKAIDRRKGEGVLSSSSSAQARASNYVDRARASFSSPQYQYWEIPTIEPFGPGNQGKRTTFKLNPSAAEFVPSLASSTVSMTTVPSGEFTALMKGDHNSINLDTDILTLPTRIGFGLPHSIAAGVTHIGVGKSGISSLTSQSTTVVPWLTAETTEMGINQAQRDLESGEKHRKQQSQRHAGTVAGSVSPTVYGMTNILGMTMMEDPASEANEDEDSVIWGSNRNCKGKEVAQDKETDAGNVPPRSADPRLWPEYQEIKPSNHSLWRNDERPRKSYTHKFIKNILYLNHLSNAITSHPTGHPSLAKIETDTMYRLYGDHRVSVVVDKKSLADRLSSASLVVHKAAGESPALALPRKVSRARVGQFMAKNGGLMRSIWRGQGWAMAEIMGRQRWMEGWKEAAGLYSMDDGEDGEEDGGVSITEPQASGEGSQARGIREHAGDEERSVETEHWSDYTWNDEAWVDMDESGDDEGDTPGYQSGEEYDEEDDDETVEERYKRLNEVMARMGLIELRRMTPGPFDATCDLGSRTIIDGQILDEEDADDVSDG
ncbi:hypothetical protein EV426DRAFT_702110 [Tirmania nivea]|nr:hypothetical protein EV426DRAFT_702110 [Tirmania nivea]